MPSKVVECAVRTYTLLEHAVVAMKEHVQS